MREYQGYSLADDDGDSGTTYLGNFSLRFVLKKRNRGINSWKLRYNKFASLDG